MLPVRRPDHPDVVTQSSSGAEKRSLKVVDKHRFFCVPYGRAWLVLLALAMASGVVIGTSGTNHVPFGSIVPSSGACNITRDILTL